MMQTNRVNRDVSRNNQYVAGNNAHKIDQRTQMPVQSGQNAPRLRQLPDVETNNAKINSLCTFILAFVIIATLGVCVVYLKAEYAVTSNSEQIMSLKNQLSEVNKQNQQLEDEIASSVNLDEVYRIATQELGMVLPSKEEVFYIGADDITYTKKYADITKPESESVSVGNVLGFISKGW